MLTLPTRVWLWSLFTVIVLGAVFATFIIASRGLRLSGSVRQAAVIASWLVAATLMTWLLFARADARAALVHQRNVGMAVVYLYFWLLAVVPSPIFGFLMARLARGKDD